MRKTFAFIVVVIAAATGKPGVSPQPSLAGLTCPTIVAGAQGSTDACPAPAKAPDRLRSAANQAKTS